MLTYADKAVRMADEGYGGAASAVSAYSTRSQCRAASGNVTGADQDASAAEAQIDAEITDAKNAEFRANLLAMRKAILTMHAQILDAMGRKADAAAKRDAAAAPL